MIHWAPVRNPASPPLCLPSSDRVRTGKKSLIVAFSSYLCQRKQIVLDQLKNFLARSAHIENEFEVEVKLRKAQMFHNLWRLFRPWVRACLRRRKSIAALSLCLGLLVDHGKRDLHFDCLHLSSSETNLHFFLSFVNRTSPARNHCLC